MIKSSKHFVAFTGGAVFNNDILVSGKIVQAIAELGFKKYLKHIVTNSDDNLLEKAKIPPKMISYPNIQRQSSLQRNMA